MDLMPSEDDALTLKPGVLEVQDQANPQLSDAQVVEHLSPLNICDAINHLSIPGHLVRRPSGQG